MTIGRTESIDESRSWANQHILVQIDTRPCPVTDLSPSHGMSESQVEGESFNTSGDVVADEPHAFDAVDAAFEGFVGVPVSQCSGLRQCSLRDGTSDSTVLVSIC